MPSATLVTGDRLDLSIPVDSPDELRALYRALVRARASERTEANRYGGLLSTGYGVTDGTRDAWRSDGWRARAQERMLDRLLGEVSMAMEKEGVEPW